jgi:hypothetical protein
MQCPRCKTHDVYVSRSGNQGVLSLLWIAARCHRCCLLFNVPRWKHVPEKPESSPFDSTLNIQMPTEEQQQPRRRAA